MRGSIVEHRLDGKSLIVKAYAARTGEQDYGDHVEQRPAEEVFHPDSLATYEGAPVTVGHPSLVTLDNVATLAVGYVRKARRAEHADASGREYVAVELVILDPPTIAAIQRGDLAEVSMGYSVILDERNVQRDIRINHAALGPSGWARCGSGCAIG